MIVLKCLELYVGQYDMPGPEELWAINGKLLDIPRCHSTVCRGTVSRPSGFERGCNLLSLHLSLFVMDERCNLIYD
jgi:hypothetical protein